MVNVFLTSNLTIVACSYELSGVKISLRNWWDPQASDFLAAVAILCFLGCACEEFCASRLPPCQPTQARIRFNL